ncbi:MAG: BadF/BadG/BcrA/BcrD ATPase family protein [Rhodothermales bacterium]
MTPPPTPASGTSARYLIGVDIGGTKTDVLVRSGPNAASIRTEGGNLRLDPADVWADRLESCLKDVLTAGHPIWMCIGAAGGGSRTAAEALEQALLARMEQLEAVQVVSDTRIAWQGAFGGESGIIVIAGTGSGCYTVDETGSEYRTGGWGPVIGDPGSGRSIGLAALRHTLVSAEAGSFSMTADRTAQALLDGARVFGPDAVSTGVLLDAFYSSSSPNTARLAPVVLGAYADGCPHARDLLLDEAGQLARQGARLVAHHAPAKRHIALVGGLVNDDGYKTILESALETELPDYTLVPPAHPPVQGALELAAAG